MFGINPEMSARIHIDEFLLTQSLDGMQRAGFKSYATKVWMTTEEWLGELDNYKNRQV